MVNEINLLLENDALIRRVMTEMSKRLQLCVERNGGHVEGK